MKTYREWKVDNQQTVNEIDNQQMLTARTGTQARMLQRQSELKVFSQIATNLATLITMIAAVRPGIAKTLVKRLAVGAIGIEKALGGQNTAEITKLRNILLQQINKVPAQEEPVEEPTV